MEKKYPFETISVEEMVKAMNASGKAKVPVMTPEEEIEDDAEYGYFQDDEEDYFQEDKDREITA